MDAPLLPAELWHLVLSLLSGRDLASVSLVSKEMREMCIAVLAGSKIDLTHVPHRYPGYMERVIASLSAFVETLQVRGLKFGKVVASSAARDVIRLASACRKFKVRFFLFERDERSAIENSEHVTGLLGWVPSSLYETGLFRHVDEISINSTQGKYLETHDRVEHLTISGYEGPIPARVRKLTAEIKSRDSWPSVAARAARCAGLRTFVAWSIVDLFERVRFKDLAGCASLRKIKFTSLFDETFPHDWIEKAFEGDFKLETIETISFKCIGFRDDQKVLLETLARQKCPNLKRISFEE